MRPRLHYVVACKTFEADGAAAVFPTSPVRIWWGDS